RGLLREQAGVDGQVFAVRRTARLDFVPARNNIPVYVGAVNARMLRAAGALADGVQLGAIVSPGYVRWAWQQIVRGATEAGRDASQIDLASNVLASVDADARAARDAVRHVLAYYIHRVEPVVLSTSGADHEELARVTQMVMADGVAAGAALVSDALIDMFAAAGTVEQVSERLQAYIDAGLRG